MQRSEILPNGLRFFNYFYISLKLPYLSKLKLLSGVLHFLLLDFWISTVQMYHTLPQICKCNTR